MLDENRLEYFLRRESAIGDRIARENARVSNYIVAKPPLPPSTGAPLARQLLDALRRPGPINVGRPVNQLGASSFHFKITSIAKDSFFDGFARRPMSAGSVASNHQSYLERGGADAAQNQQYLERGAPERGPVVASFGNLGRSFGERRDFWDTVAGAEHAPASFAIATLHFCRDPEFWKEVRSDPAAPDPLRSALASNSRKLILKDVVTTCLLMAYLRTFPATDKPPVVISPGRGGRIQTRMVIELPHEVSDQTRRSIAEAFCDNMFGKKPGIRHWAVIHAPDEHNDAKNYHLHIAFHDRPARKIPDQTGRRVWDFEICEQRYDKKNRNSRLRRPKRQNRDREFSRRDWPATARKQYAEIVNRALKDAGLTPRFDPRKYTEMGIDLDTIPRASARAYSAEKRGVVTEAASPTIEAQWARYQALLSRQYDALTLPSDIERRFEDSAIAAVQQHLPESITRQIASDCEAWKSALRLKHSALAENDALELNVRRMASRVVPIIGAPKANTPQMEYLAALSDELRAPIDRSYRQATLQERRALEALARHEAEIVLGGKYFQPPTNITRPLSSEDRLDRSTHLRVTTQPRNAPQRQADEALTLTDEVAAEAARALALQCACASASLELTLDAAAIRRRLVAQVADQAIDAQPVPRAVDRDVPAPDIAAKTTLLNFADRADSVGLLEADQAVALTDELAADAAAALALQCACASASLGLALNAAANRQRRVAHVADQAIDAEAPPRAAAPDVSGQAIAAKTTPLDYADRANSIALLEADRALTLTDELAADTAGALAFQCACASASLGPALDAATNRRRRVAHVADQAIDAEPPPRAAAPDVSAQAIAAKTTPLDYADRADSIALLEADRALTLTDELAADAAGDLAFQCACASASLGLALNSAANRRRLVAHVADQAIDAEPPLRAVDRDVPAPDVAAKTTPLDYAALAESVALLEADRALALNDELAADAAGAVALQCACASAYGTLALNAIANWQRQNARAAEPAEATNDARAQSAIQAESTRVGATIPVVLTPRKEKPDDGRNQPHAAEQFRRKEPGIAGNDRAIADSDRDDAQDAFFLPERAGGPARTTEGVPIGATARRDMGVTPSDLDSPQSPLEPDCGRGDRHRDKGEYRNLRDMPTIGGSRRTVSARPNEQATHEETHLGLQNGSEIPTGFGDYGLQPPSASAGRADQSLGVERLTPTTDELTADKERSPINQILDRLLGSSEPTTRSDFVAEENGKTTTKSSASTQPTPAPQHPESAPTSSSTPMAAPAPAAAPPRFRSLYPKRRQLTPEELHSYSAKHYSSVKPKDETPGTIPVTARRRSTRPPPEEEAPAAAVPAPPMAHPATASQAVPRTDATIGSTTSAATTRHPAETLADAKAIPTPENRPAGFAQTALDRVAPAVAATVEATTTTGSSAAAKPDGEKTAVLTKEGPIIYISGDPRNYRLLQRKPPGRER